MDSKGYESINSALTEKGLEASFSPHLFEGEQTWMFQVISAKSTYVVADVVLGAMPGVELVTSESTGKKVIHTFSHEN